MIQGYQIIFHGTLIQLVAIADRFNATVTRYVLRPNGSLVELHIPEKSEEQFDYFRATDALVVKSRKTFAMNLEEK